SQFVSSEKDRKKKLKTAIRVAPNNEVIIKAAAYTYLGKHYAQKNIKKANQNFKQAMGLNALPKDWHSYIEECKKTLDERFCYGNNVAQRPAIYYVIDQN
ncbi:MAG TPA: hypothetical protein VHA52_12890, partial [Candidatus Babeliaceae bacterium]|nr:hypothetical protein [Candidatus Babeliaceae bacterium]